jgi:hypothetical protein
MDFGLEIAQLCFTYSHRMTDTDTVSILLNRGPCLVASLEIIPLCVYGLANFSYLIVPVVHYLFVILTMDYLFLKWRVRWCSYLLISL